MSVYCVVDGWFIKRDGLSVEGAMLRSKAGSVGLCTVEAAALIFRGASAPLCTSPPRAGVLFGQGVFVDVGEARFGDRFVSGGAGRAARACIGGPHVFVASTDRPVYPIATAVPVVCKFVFGRMPPDMLFYVAGIIGPVVSLQSVCEAVLKALRVNGFLRVYGEAARHMELHRLFGTGYALDRVRHAYGAGDDVPGTVGDALGVLVPGAWPNDRVDAVSARVLSCMVENGPLAHDIARVGSDERVVDREMLLCDARLKWTGVVAQTLFSGSTRSVSAVGSAGSIAAWVSAVESL
jgi:hypothetical protein